MTSKVDTRDGDKKVDTGDGNEKKKDTGDGEIKKWIQEEREKMDTGENDSKKWIQEMEREKRIQGKLRQRIKEKRA